MSSNQGSHLNHLRHSTGYSLQGLKKAYRSEMAFRQEVWLACILIPIGLFLGNGVVEKVLLCGSILFVLIIELLNSAIETVVDRIGTEKHELSGKAKDIGSAAVFLALMLCGLTWFLILFV